MAVGIRDVGDFCWINVLSPQPEKSRAFFARLMQWTYVDMAGMGHRIQLRGRDIGGFFDVISPRTPQGAEPSIGVMIKVQDANYTASRVKSLGGTAMPAFDVGGAGRMAVCFDPNGAEFDVWEPKGMPGFDVDSSLPGAPSWFEATSRNVKRDREFYGGLFGWAATEVSIPPVTYTMFSRKGPPIAGMVPSTPENAQPKPHWGVYFTVQNPDETTKLARLMGAKIRIAPKDIPGVGRFACIVSPEGVPFYVIRYSG